MTSAVNGGSLNSSFLLGNVGLVTRFVNDQGKKKPNPQMKATADAIGCLVNHYILVRSRAASSKQITSFERKSLAEGLQDYDAGIEALKKRINSAKKDKENLRKAIRRIESVANHCRQELEDEKEARRAAVAQVHKEICSYADPSKERKRAVSQPPAPASPYLAPLPPLPPKGEGEQPARKSRAQQTIEEYKERVAAVNTELVALRAERDQLKQDYAGFAQRSAAEESKLKQTLADLEKKLEQKQNELTALQEVHAASDQKFEQKTAQLQKELEQTKTLYARQAEALSNAQKLKAENSEQRKRLYQEKKKLDQELAMINKKSKEKYELLIKTKDELLKRAGSDLKSLQEKLQHAEKAKGALENQLVISKGQVKTLEDRVTNLSDQLQSEEKAKNALEKKLVEAETKEQEKAAYSSKLMEELFSTLGKEEPQVEDVSSDEEGPAAPSKANQVLLDHNEDLLTSLEEKEKTIEKLQSQLKVAEQEKVSLGNKIKELRNQVNKQLQEKQELLKQQQQASAEALKMKEEVEQLRQEKTAHQKVNERLELAELEKKNLEAKQQELIDDIQDLQEENQDQTGLIEKLKKEVEAFDAEIKELQTQVNELLQEKKELSKQYVTVQEQLTQAKAGILEAKEKIQQLSQERDALTQKLNQADTASKATIAALKKELQEEKIARQREGKRIEAQGLSEEILGLREKFKAINAEREKLQTQVNELEQQLETAAKQKRGAVLSLKNQLTSKEQELECAKKEAWSAVNDKNRITQAFNKMIGADSNQPFAQSVKDFINDLTKTRKERAAAQKQMAAVGQALESLPETQGRSLAQRVNALVRSSLMDKRYLENLEGQIAILKRQLEPKEKELAQAGKVGELEAQVQEKVRVIQSLQGKLELAQADLKNVRESASAVESGQVQELQKQTKQAEAAQTQLQSTSQRVHSLWEIFGHLMSWFKSCLDFAWRAVIFD